MENFRGYHDQGVRWFVSSLVLIAAGCEYRYALDTISVQTEGDSEAGSSTSNGGATTDGLTSGGLTTEGSATGEATGTDGTTTDGTATDGTATDGTATAGTTTDATTTDGTTTDGTTTGEELCGNGVVEVGEECDGDGWGDQCVDCKLQWFYVFASSVAYRGDLGGVAGADKKCQGLAGDVNLKGRYLAWIADGTNESSPVNRFSFKKDDSREFRLPSGDVVASNWSALLTKSPSMEIAENEKRDTFDQKLKVYRDAWSGVDSNGYADATANTCGAWTDFLTGKGLVGRIWRENFGKNNDCTDGSKWSSCYDLECWWWAHLYCFQVPPVGD
jgi:hypothetical protein